MTVYSRSTRHQPASVPRKLADIEQSFESHAQELLRQMPYKALRLFNQCLIDAAKSRKFEAMGQRLTKLLALKSAELSRELKCLTRLNQ